MTLNNEIEITKINVGFTASILLVSHLLEYQFIKDQKSFFDNHWTNTLIATILGYILYSMLLHRASITISNHLELENYVAYQSVYDIIKYGSVFISKELITAQLESRYPTFNQQWRMETGYTILGYIIFNVLSVNLPDVDSKYQALVNDLLKVTLGELTSKFIMYHTISYNNIITLVGMLGGVLLYYLVIKDLITKKQANYVGGVSILNNYALEIIDPVSKVIKINIKNFEN